MAKYAAYLQNLGIHNRSVAIVPEETEIAETATVKLLGTFDYEEVGEAHERRAVAFHHVRELLYKANITDLHLVKILDPEESLPPVVPETPDVGGYVTDNTPVDSEPETEEPA